MEELNVSDPFPATLNPELLTAFSTCGYSRQQLFKCVVKFFHITCGRYPSIPMAAVLADRELKQREDMLDHYRNVIERKDQVIDQMESVMEAKDQLTKATIVSINQKRDIQLQENRQQTQALERQLQIFEQQIQERGVQVRQRVQQNQVLKQLIQALDEQIQIYEQQIPNLEQQIQIFGQQIPNLEQQIQALANEYSRLRSKGCPPLNTDSVTTCMFCLQEIKMVMFTPCKHVCCGIKCLPKFKNKPCPLCRVKIQDWKFVFIV